MFFALNTVWVVFSRLIDCRLVCWAVLVWCEFTTGDAGFVELHSGSSSASSGMVSCGGVIMACACWMMSLLVRIHGFGAGSGASFISSPLVFVNSSGEVNAALKHEGCESRHTILTGNPAPPATAVVHRRCHDEEA